MKKKQKQSISYFVPMIIAVLSVSLYTAFVYSDSLFCKLMSLYLMATVLLPILATWLANLCVVKKK